MGPKSPNMVLNVKFSQPYSQHPLRVWVYVRSRISFVWFLCLQHSCSYSFEQFNKHNMRVNNVECNLLYVYFVLIRTRMNQIVNSQLQSHYNPCFTISVFFVQQNIFFENNLT